ncbi:MAG: hypothetical protein WC915_02165 [archaeon]|jgi:hypothetical protein
MARKISSTFGATPGQLYSGISALGEDFSKDASDGKMLIAKDDPFVTYCKGMGRKFPQFRKGAVFSDKHKQAVEFLGWRLSPGDFMAAIKGTFLMYSIPIIILIILIYTFGIGISIGELNTGKLLGEPILLSMVGYDESTAFMFFMLIALILFGVLGMGVYMIYSYPFGVAEDEKNKALTYVPEMIGYMIMSMKLVPNLEKSIEFSAKHGRGRIATEFKRLIWDFQIGVHESIAEGLDSLAYRWAEYSSELKESLMKIRASVMEPSESQRYELLDKTMVEVLESVKSKMEDYARSLNQPAVMLFYLGVLLPLILIIILPVGSAFSGSPLANTPILILIYCIGIPAIAYTFAKNVVKKRPPTYEPPIIPDDFAELPKKWSMKVGRLTLDARVVSIAIVIVGLSLSLFLSLEGFPPKFLLQDSEDPYMNISQIIPADKTIEEILLNDGLSPTEYGKKTIDLYFIDDFDFKKGDMYLRLLDEGIPEDVAYKSVVREVLIFTTNPKTDPTKNLFVSGLIITLVLALSVLLYYQNIHKRNAQLNIIKMEEEFKESMYVIASRMGENKPVESALKSTKEFLPNLIISKRIFGKTIENIELMGLPLEGAVFDPIYGSMKGIPSKTLRTAMQLLVDSVSLGVEVASRTLMSLSLQMENMDKVNKSLKDLVSEVSSTMMTMAIFIGPIVLGITVSLQKVVMMTLAGVVTDPALEAAKELDLSQIAGSSGVGVDIGSLFNVSIESFQQFASPLTFLMIISIYVIEIVIIMIYFTTKVEEDNDLLFKINLARYLPIAVIIFVVTAFGANLLMAGMM